MRKPRKLRLRCYAACLGHNYYYLYVFPGEKAIGKILKWNWIKSFLIVYQMNGLKKSLFDDLIVIQLHFKTVNMLGFIEILETIY